MYFVNVYALTRVNVDLHAAIQLSDKYWFNMGNMCYLTINLFNCTLLAVGSYFDTFEVSFESSHCCATHLFRRLRDSETVRIVI